jgi:Domain of unknown function (DUF6946)
MFADPEEPALYRLQLVVSYYSRNSSRPMELGKHGTAVTDLDSWLALAPPKGGLAQWQDGHSAKELARAWVGNGRLKIPEELSRLFLGSADFSEIELVRGEPEARVSFDGRVGEPRNADLSIDATVRGRPVAISIEAKADEPFGELMPDALSSAVEALLTNERSGALARASELCRALLPSTSKGLPAIRELRYQLLTATAGALAHAQAIGAETALLLIHEFRREGTESERRRRQNATDLNAYLRRISSDEHAIMVEGQLAGPILVPGAPLFAVPPALYIGKISRAC